MNFVLLTGAGFSRNWGGWLADEVFEELASSSEIAPPLRHELWKAKDRSLGFENVLAELQQRVRTGGSIEDKRNLEALEQAVGRIFEDMNKAFESTPFEKTSEVGHMVRDFLVRFDAIFTLNQDLLLERFYLDGNIALSGFRKWDGGMLPGIRTKHSGGRRSYLETQEPDASGMAIAPRTQPYFKLHGSSNWVDETGIRMLVVGGEKTASIGKSPLLKWYHEQFREYLFRPNTKLMIIGYGFGDSHINAVIQGAADAGQLSIFIVDPSGSDVIDKRPRGLGVISGPPAALVEKLRPCIVGVSRRPLASTFRDDYVEHDKLMRFF